MAMMSAMRVGLLPTMRVQYDCLYIVKVMPLMKDMLWDLLEAARVGIVELDSQVRQTGDAERVGHKGALDSSEVLQHRWVDDRFGILEIRCDDIHVCILDVGIGNNDLRIRI